MDNPYSAMGLYHETTEFGTLLSVMPMDVHVLYVKFKVYALLSPFLPRLELLPIP